MRTLAIAFLAMIALASAAQAQYSGPRVPYAPYAPYGFPRNYYPPPQRFMPPEMGPGFTWRWYGPHGYRGYQQGIDRWGYERFYRPWPPYGPP